MYRLSKPSLSSFWEFNCVFPIPWGFARSVPFWNKRTGSCLAEIRQEGGRNLLPHLLIIILLHWIHKEGCKKQKGLICAETWRVSEVVGKIPSSPTATSDNGVVPKASNKWKGLGKISHFCTQVELREHLLCFLQGQTNIPEDREGL